MYKVPIVIFAYNRPTHFKRVMIALENSKIKNKIYLFLDGPKDKKDKILQKDILSSVSRVGKFNNYNKNQIKIFKNKRNLGLAKSISKGLDKMSNKYKNFIVLEDDVIPYSNMIPFLSKCLAKYKYEKKIGAICAYQFFNFEKNSKFLETKFLKHFIPWGWAIWSDRWKRFRRNHKINYSKVPKFITSLKRKLDKKKVGKRYWSLNFMIYNYCNDNNFIFPNYSLAKNIGFDGSGTNSLITNDLYVLEKDIKKFRYNDIKLKKFEMSKQEKLFKKVSKNFYN